MTLKQRLAKVEAAKRQAADPDADFHLLVPWLDSLAARIAAGDESARAEVRAAMEAIKAEGQ